MIALHFSVTNRMCLVAMLTLGLELGINGARVAAFKGLLLGRRPPLVAPEEESGHVGRLAQQEDQRGQVRGCGGREGEILLHSGDFGLC